MPSSDSDDRRPTRPQHGTNHPPEPEQLPCPRCSSTNTKFCYYNNYNFSQPRHFCKSCRRYWTHGGTLRDVPVGGATRKNAKRSRTNAPPPSSDHHNTPVVHSATQAFAPFSSAAAHGVNGINVCGSFTSLLSTQGAPGSLALGGFGPGFEDVGFGLGRAGWAFQGIGDGTGHGVASGIMGNTWQIASGGEGGFSGTGGGDYCFCLPGLAISNPGSGLK